MLTFTSSTVAIGCEYTARLQVMSRANSKTARLIKRYKQSTFNERIFL